MNVPILSLTFISGSLARGETEKKTKIFLLAFYATVPTEVFCEAKMPPIHLPTQCLRRLDLQDSQYWRIDTTADKYQH